jgi:hypothetical protein
MDLKIDGWTKPAKPVDRFVGLNSTHLSASTSNTMPTLKSDRPTLFSMRYCPYVERVVLVALAKDIE